jgi:hypothetical protein
MAPSARRFPPRDILPASQAGNSASLLTLGKRTERLLFSGLVLTGLCFAEVCFTLVMVQFEQNKSQAAVREFGKRIQNETVYLNALYTLHGASTATPPSPIKSAGKTADTASLRESLGLPRDEAPLFSGSSDSNDGQPSKEPASYAQALDGIADDVTKQEGNEAAVLQPFKDPKLGPGDILAKTKASEQREEKEPIEMLGIRAPHSIEVEYGGSSFQFQYGVISTILLALIGPLICGWMTSLYMTRQREMIEISRAATLTTVFPHIMNFVPFMRERLLTRPLTPEQMKGQASLLAFLRVIIAVVIVAPMLTGYVGSLILSWPYSDAVYFAIPFLVYVFFQTLGLIVMEGAGLPGTYFAEG